MGVRGLTTFINSNQDLYMKNYYLHDTNLVIDGLSLSAQLYRSLKCFSAFGGDYDKYSSFVKNFFKNLRRCNVTSFVVFDGSYEEKKLRTAYNRLRSKLKSASMIDPITQINLQIFPLLLRDVFVEALKDMNIAYTVCEFEADDEIASLAKHLNCPVLSYDSDFFIYNVLYIPFNTIDLKSKPLEKDSLKVNAMECKIFKVQYLTEKFGGLHKDLLPLLAILLGNDYVEKKVFRKFFSQLKLQKSKKKKNDQQKSIYALFNWLQNETLDTAISKILGRLKKHHKDKVLGIIKRGIEGYNSKKCLSIYYFDIPEVKSSHEPDVTIQEINNETVANAVESFDDNNFFSNVDCSDDDSQDNESCNSVSSDDNDAESSADEELINESEPNNLSDLYVAKVRKNLIPAQYLNLYTHHIHFCNPQPEDFTDEDSFLSTLPILRYAFDILTDFAHDHCVYISRENSSSYKKVLVGKDYGIPRPIPKSFCELTTEELRLFFYSFFEQKMPDLDLNTILLLPTNFQLFMLAILWWIANCNVPTTHVHSLIVSYIILNVIDERTGTARGHFHFNNKHKKKLEELRSRQDLDVTLDEELYLNKNKVQYEDCLVAASVLLKHFEIDDSIRKRPKTYDIKRMHSFSQFQCVLQQINCLNVLCGLPFEETVYSKCYNGTFIYNIALKLENQIDPESFFKQYIKGATTILMFYKSICSILKKLVSQMNLSTVKWSKKKKPRRKKNNDELSLLAKEFESEVFI